MVHNDMNDQLFDTIEEGRRLILRDNYAVVRRTPTQLIRIDGGLIKRLPNGDWIAAALVKIGDKFFPLVQQAVDAIPIVDTLFDLVNWASEQAYLVLLDVAYNETNSWNHAIRTVDKLIKFLDELPDGGLLSAPFDMIKYGRYQHWMQVHNNRFYDALVENLMEERDSGYDEGLSEAPGEVTTIRLIYDYPVGTPTRYLHSVFLNNDALGSITLDNIYDPDHTGI